MMSENSRKNERAALDLYINKIIGDEPHLARVRDISTGGLFLYKLIEPEIADGEFGLEIKLPDSDEVIWAVGEVVRQEQYDDAEGVALRFTRLAESDRRLIEGYVSGRRGEVAA
jgi:hypothetical protein